MRHTNIDLDDLGTWPEAVSSAACLAAGSATLDELLDHWLPDDEVVAFNALLRHHHLRGYHATRLLDEERDKIRREGLVALSEGLIHERLQIAADLGLLSSEEKAHLLANSAFARGQAKYREGRVCFVLGQFALREGVTGLDPFLSTWGGEGIYMQLDRSEWEPLATFGRPSIVVADLDMSAQWKAFPDLLKVFALSSRNGSATTAELHYMRSVGPESVRAIWQPGDPEYDRYSLLPRI